MQARPPEAPHCPSGEVTHCPSAHPRTEWLLGHRACGFKTRTSGSPSTQGGTGHTASPVGVHGWCLHRRGTAEGDQRSWGGGGWHCFCPCLESRILPTKDSLALWRKTSLGPNCPRAARAGAQDRGGGGISGGPASGWGCSPSPQVLHFGSKYPWASLARAEELLCWRARGHCTRSPVDWGGRGPPREGRQKLRRFPNSMPESPSSIRRRMHRVPRGDAPLPRQLAGPLERRARARSPPTDLKAAPSTS